MKCSNCNNNIPKNALFCRHCGVKVVETPNPNTNGGDTARETKMKTKKKISLKIIVPIIAVLVIIIIIGGFILFNFLNSHDRLALKASKLVEEQKYEEALEFYNKILVKDPKNIEIYLELEKIYGIMGKEDLQRISLERGIQEVEDNLPLKLVLGKYLIEHDLGGEGEKMFLQILKTDDKNVVAYESLMEIYDGLNNNDSILDLHNQYGDKINSDKATIFVASSYFDTGELDEANRLFESVNLDKINDSTTLGKAAMYYIEVEDKEKALLIANKGLKTEDPSVFNGIIYGLTNDKKLNLATMKTGDIVGDGKKENILLMTDKVSGMGADYIELCIQDGSSGNIIDTISLGDYGGYPNKLDIGDLNHDGILDILVCIHSGGTGGFQDHYAYSFKDKNKVDLLDGLSYNIDIRFADGFKAFVFSEEIQRAFEIDIQGEQKQRYIEDGHYTANGMLLNTMYGYFKGDEMDVFLIEDINQYGLKHSTSLIGPAYNSDYIAGVETIYLFKNGKWVIHDLKIGDSDNIISSIDIGKISKEPVLQGSIERLDEMFAMTKNDIFKKHGTPLYTDWYTGSEYFMYEDITYFVYDNEVVMISLGEGQEIFDIKHGSKIDKIRNTLGKADFDGYRDGDEGGEEPPGHFVEYDNIGGYSIEFYSPTKDGGFSNSIRRSW